MPAQFKDHDEQYVTYESAKEVKERNDQYVVYDAYGSVLGVHLVDSVELFTTDPARIKVPDQD